MHECLDRIGPHWTMKFRLTVSGFHLLGSAAALALVLGSLYWGWYRWPGWYLTNSRGVVSTLVVVDAALGPMLTLLVANPAKPRRELARDIGVIVAVQLLALAYGTATLWRGRPLYYTFSEDRLQLVQASDLSAPEIARARAENPRFAPWWYSRPRWVWAPLPADPTVRARIVQSSLHGGDDVIQMPRYFRPWDLGLPVLRTRLLKVTDQPDVRLYRKKARLAGLMAQQGFPPDQPITMLTVGRAAPLLAVFDPATLEIRAFLRSDFPPGAVAKP
jgi:hypothetical protein